MCLTVATFSYFPLIVSPVMWRKWWRDTKAAIQQWGNHKLVFRKCFTKGSIKKRGCDLSILVVFILVWFCRVGLCWYKTLLYFFIEFLVYIKCSWPSQEDESLLVFAVDRNRTFLLICSLFIWSLCSKCTMWAAQQCVLSTCKLSVFMMFVY